MTHFFTLASLPSIAVAVLGITGCGRPPAKVSASPRRAWEGETVMNSGKLPQPWVIRSDFSSDETWQKVQRMIAAPQRHGRTDREFYAYVKYINDRKYGSKSPREIFRSLPDDYLDGFCFIVDAECIQNAEHPVLVVAYRPTEAEYESFTLRKPSEAPLEQIAMFRALPSQIQNIQNNLSIGNMDFEEFANNVDPEGVFRGFKR